MQADVAGGAPRRYVSGKPGLNFRASPWRWVPVICIPWVVGIFEVATGAGLAAVPAILVAAVLGLAVASVAPSVRASAILTVLVTSLLLSLCYVHNLQTFELGEEEAMARAEKRHRLRRSAAQTGARVGGGMRAASEAISLSHFWSATSGRSPKVPLETLSVVLPCAMEGSFAAQTVEAVIAHTKRHRLHEIIVVDDGSRPPLLNDFPRHLLKPQGPVVMLRHEKTMGLITTKKVGGDNATGDVIVFFDCHISPRDGWEEAFLKQMKRAGDHRTVVVPTITSLDPDTWTEIPNGPSSSACYILLNADFTWMATADRDVPLMSGGLLGISRQWWEETGGYDEHMVAWGGENIDQSLRTWLCGGRIEAAQGAYVAHMWRDPKKPKTILRYPIPTEDVMRNKARAVTAWFEEFREKVFTFPEYENFVDGSQSIGDMSNFDRLRSRLTCKPFSHYIHRFSYVYLDTGLIPEQIFQLKEEMTGLCLERVPTITPQTTALVPCAGEDDGGGPGSISELQIWHAANTDRSQPAKGCCSGFMNWNFLQCLDAQGPGSPIRTYECSISGFSGNQLFRLSPDGQLTHRSGDKDNHGGCAAPQMPLLGHATFMRAEEASDAVLGNMVEVVDDSFHVIEEATKHLASFRLRVVGGDHGQAGDQGVCATGGGGTGGGGAGWKLGFDKCDEKDSQQSFHTSSLLGGLQVRVGDTNLCLDAAGGGDVLIYPCYEEKFANMNQVWWVSKGHLVWQRGAHPEDRHLVGFAEDLKKERSATAGETWLRTCSDKRGQRFRRSDTSDDSTFLLRDADSDRCLGLPAKDGHNYQARNLVVTQCDTAVRWKEDSGNLLLTVNEGWCLDATQNYDRPTLMSCYGGRTQKWKVDDAKGWVKVLHAWEDNGRRRYYERCIDYEPVDPVDVSVQSCTTTLAKGVRWTRLHPRESREHALWRQAAKPKPGDPVLGGSMSHN